MISIVSITTPADNTALTTVERMQQELSIAGNDELLAAKIDEATSDIAIRCRPLLRRETLTETFWHDHGRFGTHDVSRSPPLILRRFPVVSIDTVTLDDVVIDASEYRLDADTGLLYRLTSSGFPGHWRFGKSAVIAYTAGYTVRADGDPTLPPSLEAAAIELVSSYWHSRGRDPLLKSEENFGVARFDYWVGAVGASGDLPPGVMAKIAPYQGVIVG